jgi:hypothetical protein
MDHVTIANRAISRIGGIRMQSFDQPGPAGKNAVDLYWSVIEDLMGKYPWHFTKKKAALSRETDAPVFGWTYKFLLPPDRLGPPRAIYDSPAVNARPFTNWEPNGQHILANVEALWCEYPWKPDPDWWPAYFRELSNLCLMAEYAGALREDWTLRAKLRLEAYGSEQMQGEGGQFAVATALDAQAQPAPEIDGGRNPITAVRYGPGDARSGYEDW